MVPWPHSRINFKWKIFKCKKNLKYIRKHRISTTSQDIESIREQITIPPKNIHIYFFKRDKVHYIMVFKTLDIRQWRIVIPETEETKKEKPKVAHAHCYCTGRVNWDYPSSGDVVESRETKAARVHWAEYKRGGSCRERTPEICKKSQIL